MKETKSVVSLQKIENAIITIRGQKVILDKDLAILYNVSTSVLNKAVTRNIERFPSDFLFQLTKEEFSNLKSHFGTSSWGGTRKLPRAFTEQGVAMLSSVLRSKRAVQVNIEIMRVFVKLRDMLSAHHELALKLAEIEKRFEDHDEKIEVIFEAIRQLMAPPEKKGNKIGFEVNEGGIKYGRETRLKRFIQKI